MAGWGGTNRLPRRIGKSAALHMLITGDRIPATQALSIGLVDELTPPADLLAAALWRARASQRSDSEPESWYCRSTD
jgi:enoyl-CoA hydratase